MGSVNEREEKETISHLKQELKKIDAAFEPAPLHQFELNRQLARFKQERKRAMQKELLCFMVSAFVILSLYITISIQVPVLFLMVQGAALILLPALVMFEKKRRRTADGEVEIDEP